MMLTKVEEYNQLVRDKWIAKCLGISYRRLMNEKFFVASDENSKQLIVTFMPSTDLKLLQRCNNYDGTNIFRLANDHDPYNAIPPFTEHSKGTT